MHRIVIVVWCLVTTTVDNGLGVRRTYLDDFPTVKACVDFGNEQLALHNTDDNGGGHADIKRQCIRRPKVVAVVAQ